jgi:hypothetical protein
VGHRAPAVDEDTHLAADLRSDLGQAAGELLGDQSFGRETATEQALQGANLAGTEALGVSEDSDLAIPFRQSP